LEWWVSEWWAWASLASEWRGAELLALALLSGARSRSVQEEAVVVRARAALALE
jgi:hypothetical protein